MKCLFPITIVFYMYIFFGILITMAQVLLTDEYMIVIHINYNKDRYCSLIVTIPLLH